MLGSWFASAPISYGKVVVIAHLLIAPSIVVAARPIDDVDYLQTVIGF